MILCGWCGVATSPDRCASCGRDPEVPYLQRGQPVRIIEPEPGRPALDADEVRRKYADARASLVSEGRPATVEAIAERLDRSPRTVREWRKRYSLR